MSNKQKKEKHFEWSEFNSDIARIKAYSNRYREKSIVEAFEDVYKVSIGQIKESVNDTPKDLRVGDEISLNILSINKNRVEFDVGNSKTQIVSNTNLHKYYRFKHNLPLDPVKVRVMDITKDKVVVDPIAPLVNGFLNPILRDKNVQKVVGNPMSVRVKNLQLTRGGFTGKAVLPNVSEFVGEDYTVDVFIPGSQIVLNITDDFEQFVGKEIDAFIINFMSKPESNTLSLIASAKELIKFRGECKLIDLFKSWCEESELWKEYETKEIEGCVTGVINSSKKCGVFVELPSLEMTGLVSIDPDKLVNYKPNTPVKVKFKGFDEEKKFNPFTKQMEHIEPYSIKEGVLRSCNLKPVLEFVD